MRLLTYLLCAVSVMAALRIVPAAAQGNPAFQARRLVHFGDWSVFRVNVDKGPKCWVATEVKPDGTGLDDIDSVADGRILILFTVGANEFSITAAGGQFYTKQGAVEVGSKRYGLFFRQNWAWLSRKNADGELRSMFNAQSSGTLMLGDVGFTIGLKGFDRAVQAASGACNQP